jgi:hypothetical protein
MQRHLFKDGVVFFQLQTLCCGLFILGCYITRSTGHAAGLMLRTFKNYLYPTTFLCHFLKKYAVGGGSMQ